MSGACRCRNHAPTADGWLIVSGHFVVSREEKLVIPHARCRGQVIDQVSRASRAARDRSQRCEAIPGRAGPTFLGQSRLVSEERLARDALPGSHWRNWGGTQVVWIITRGESEARRIFLLARSAERKCGLPNLNHTSRRRLYGSSKLHGYGVRSTFGSTFGL